MMQEDGEQRDKRQVLNRRGGRKRSNRSKGKEMKRSRVSQPKGKLEEQHKTLLNSLKGCLLL